MKKQTKKSLLKTTAKKLFLSHGIKRVTIEEICEVAGVSKVTYYKYYKNKMALALEIKDELINEGFATFDEINALKIPFMEKIERMTQWQTSFFSQINNDFIRDVASIEEIEDLYKKRFLENIRSGQKSGEIRPDINLELVYLMIRKLQEISLEGEWKTLFTDYSEYTRQVRAVFFYGLLTRP